MKEFDDGFLMLALMLICELPGVPIAEERIGRIEIGILQFAERGFPCRCEVGAYLPALRQVDAIVLGILRDISEEETQSLVGTDMAHGAVDGPILFGHPDVAEMPSDGAVKIVHPDL